MYLDPKWSNTIRDSVLSALIKQLNLDGQYRVSLEANQADVSHNGVVKRYSWKDCGYENGELRLIDFREGSTYYMTTKVVVTVIYP